MNAIEVVSFDVEGTLVTADFSYAVWSESIPMLYAERHSISDGKARKIVMEEYQRIGDQRLEWFDKFDLGIPEPVMDKCQNKVLCYSEVRDVLMSLSGKYKLIVASGAPRDFLEHLLRDVKPYFDKIFSSISDYRQSKTTGFYLEMCQAMNVRPEQVVHVGDSWQDDFIAAGETGIHAFYLDRMGRTDHRGSLLNLSALKDYLLD